MIAGGRVQGDQETAAGGLRHLALLYQGPADYLVAVLGWIQAALARAEPVLVAVPGPASARLRQDLGEGSSGVRFADMAELGRNPARIISAFIAFAAEHGGRPVCCLSEPVWPSRSAAEVREAARNEALVNVALAVLPATELGPYNGGALRPYVIAGARRTHPAIVRDGTLRESPGYPGSELRRPTWDRPLPLPPRRAESFSYDSDLRALREFITVHASRSGLDADRTTDLVLSVSEVAANTLRHTRQPGRVRAWRTRDEFLCQVTDSGQINDPLAGLRPPSASQLGGQGLWVVNKVCDLVELRTGPDGTTIRLHMRLGQA